MFWWGYLCSIKAMGNLSYFVKGICSFALEGMIALLKGCREAISWDKKKYFGMILLCYILGTFNGVWFLAMLMSRSGIFEEEMKLFVLLLIWWIPCGYTFRYAENGLLCYCILFPMALPIFIMTLVLIGDTTGGFQHLPR